MPESQDQIDALVNAGQVANSFYELQNRAIIQAIPGATGAATALRAHAIANTALDFVGVAHSIYTAPSGQELDAASNALMNVAASNIIRSSVTALSLPLTPAVAVPLGIIAGAATSLALEHLDIDWKANASAAFSEQGVLTAIANKATHAYKTVIDTAAGTITYYKDNLELMRSTVDASSHVSELSITRAQTELTLNLATGAMTIRAPGGQIFTANISDTSFPTSVQAPLEAMLDALDADLRVTQPQFSGLRSLLPEAAYDAAIGYSSLTSRGWKAYADGDFSYRYDTTSTHFEISSKTVNAHYGADGVQTIMYTDPTNSQWYFLQVRADGSKFLAYAGHETGVSFNKFGELPDHFQGALQRMEIGVNEQIGDKVHSFFTSHPSENTNLPGILSAMTGDPGVSAVPPVPGRKPPVPGQTDTESADDGVTYTLTEERTVIVNSQVYRFQQFSSRVDVDSFSNQDLRKLVQGDYAGYSPETGDDVRIRALSELAIRWSQNPQTLINDNLAFVPASNGGALSAVLISGQTAIGSITAVQKGNFKIQAIETIGVGNAADVVQIVTEDSYAGTGARSQPLNITYPETFNFQYAGGYFGGLLAGIAADDNLFKQVVYKSLFTTVGETVGTFADFISIPQNTIQAARYGATQGIDTALRDDIPELSTRLAGNLAATIANVLGQRIVDHLTDAVDVHGVTGEIFDVAVGTVTIGAINEFLNFTFRGVDGGVYSNLLKSGFDFNQPIEPNSQTTIGDAIKSQMMTVLAAYAGTRLAGEIVSPESQQAAIFGSIGSALATSIASNAGILANMAISQAVSKALTAAFGTTMSPIVGAAIGAFVGQVLGTAIGNMFASHDEPISWATVKYDGSSKSFYLNAAWGDDGGNPDIAHNMANVLRDGVNDIIELTGGALRRDAKAPTVELGLDGSRFGVIVDGNPAHYFNSAAEAIQDAALQLLKGFDLVGGYAILMRAWHNSDATTLEDFKHDLEVAEAFQAYLANPTGIIALLMDQPQSPAAIAWAKVLERASELQLHLPSERDLDGGWGELLAARGDIDPSVIPTIDGEAIVVTDPTTGEQIRLEHVIGPGYEIVRVPGTDGNDIINLVVDGPSITYVDAMAGDDVINGSDQSDIILGGAGNDTINGNAGDDWINGGPGNDTINGNGGIDLIYGSDDDDVLTGAEQNDDIYGGAGNDILRGLGGYDRLHGGDGNDTLYSTDDIPGDDLYGDAGNDTIDVDTRFSNIYGGAGDDTIILRDHSNVVHIGRGDGHDTIIYSGQYANTVRFDSTLSINELWFKRVNQDLKVLILGENQSVTIDHYFDRPNAFSIEGRDGYLKMINDAWYYHNQYSSQPTGTYNIISDSVLASRPSTILWSINDNSVDYQTTEIDTDQNFVTTYPQNRIVVGGNGNDTFHEEYATVTAYGGAGADTFFGNETPTAVTQAFFYGDAGNDTITGSRGQDRLFGGTGDDTIYGEAAADVIYGNYGKDKLYGGADNDILIGGQGNDYLNGDAGDDQLLGEDGDDKLTDAYGNNIMVGGAGIDTITAGNGNDSLDGGTGNDILTGGGGNDRLYGGEDDDTLTAGAGDDYLSGGSGADILDGGTGSDALYGGDGNDILVYTLSDNLSTSETVDGGAGTDKLRVNLTAAQFSVAHNVGDLLRLQFALAEHASQNVQSQFSFVFTAFALSVAAIEQIEIVVDGTAQTIAYSAIDGLSGPDTITATAAHNLISANAGDDTVTSSSGDDVIIGGAGNDTINAGHGWNLVRGEGGNDVIVTGDDADDLSGGDGNDTLHAGGGNDKLSGGDGNDILDGATGDDNLIGGLGSDSLDGGAGNDYLYGQADNDNLSGGDGADTLDGGSGDDSLRGGKLADRLTGGAGADLFIWAAGDADGSVDTISDWSTADGDTLSFDRLLTFGRLPTDNINDYLKLTTATAATTLSIDFNGTLGGASFVPFIEFTNPAGLTSISSLLAAGRIIITPVNNAPVAKADSFTFFVGGSRSGNVLIDNGNGADSDPDGDALSITPVTLATAQGGSVILSANGNFVYSPTNPAITSDTFTYTVQDGFGGSSTATAQITISQPNLPPAPTADTYTINEDSPATFVPLANDTDPENNALSLLHVTRPLYGSATVSGNSVAYTPNANFSGLDSFLYLVSDTAGNLAASKASLTVNYDASHTVRQGTAGNDSWDNTGTTNDIYYLGLGNDYAKSWGGDDIAYYTGGLDTLFSKTPGSIDIIHVGSAFTINNAAISVSDFTYAIHNSGSGYFDHVMIAFDTANKIVLQSAARSDNTEYRWDKLYFSDGFSVSLDAIENWITAADGNASNNTIFGNATANTVSGGAGNDEIIGYAGNDTLSGDDGNDLIYGGLDNDSLLGGAGDDKLWGSLGNDLLNGGAGSDYLSGGSGADTFRLDSASGIDHIADFSIADGDTINIADLITGYDHLTDAITDFVRISESGGHSILAIDTTGSGNSYQVRAILENATGLTDEDALLQAGRLAA